MTDDGKTLLRQLGARWLQEADRKRQPTRSNVKILGLYGAALTKCAQELATTLQQLPQRDVEADAVALLTALDEQRAAGWNDLDRLAYLRDHLQAWR